MCGIAGVLDLKRRTVDVGLVQRLCDQLVHRGPDDDGYYVAGPAGLGQRRLSIIDLSTGDQPMSNEDGTIWITFNGEIYNFQELRHDLRQMGHTFSTASDTEAIVHAYEQYGPLCVSRLRGMFAFALWDQRKETLLLARDRVGKKPLFYTQTCNQLVFASELQALVAHPEVCREPNLTAIDDYLTYGYIPAPKTAFNGIYKLPPAHYLTVQLPERPGEEARINVEQYWQLEYTPKVNLSEQEAIDGLLEVLTEAVRLRLIADVPLGALLSGGVDSGIVVALMSQLTSQPVKTFSIGFQEQDFNELPYAQRVAERYGTDHHELVVRADASGVLSTLVRHFGEPYADSSAIPTYYVAKLTREHVKVALNGDGGDENFAGYLRYRGNSLADRYQKIPAVLRSRLIEPVASRLPDVTERMPAISQSKHFLEAAAQPFDQRYLRWVSYFSPEQKQALYSAEFQRQLGGYEGRAWMLRQIDRVCHNGKDHLDTMLSVDVQSYLAYDLLVKMDIATMANSLEARAPFLDHKVMEFCARLPSHYKLMGTTSKYLLKKVGRKLLPPENVSHRKMGFAIPLSRWLRHELRPLMEDTLLSESSRISCYCRPAAVHQLVRSHVRGEHDYAYQLWALLWLELWHREFIDQAARPQ